MSNGDPISESVEFDSLTSVLSALRPLGAEGRERVLASVQAFFGMSVRSPIGTPIGGGFFGPTAAGGGLFGPTAAARMNPRDEDFSEDRSPSAKEFLLEKRPQSDVERIACLAYYLTHYRGTQHFKTVDLSKLNTEAAQPKMSNAAQAVDNASKAGLLVPAIKGSKQLSSAGELYVQALPDRVAAKRAAAEVRPKKKARRAARGFGNPQNSVDGAEDDE